MKNVLTRKKLILAGFAVAAGAADHFAGTELLPMILNALLGL